MTNQEKAELSMLIKLAKNMLEVLDLQHPDGPSRRNAHKIADKWLEKLKEKG